MVKSCVSKAPEARSRTVGADKLPTLKVRVESASLLNTTRLNSSIPARFPWLSSMGTVIIILKLAKAGREFCELFDGSKYGSPGVTITEFARIFGGGKLEVDQTPGFAKISAIVVRSVVIAAVGIIPPSNSESRKAQAIRAPCQLNYYPCDKGLG